MTGFPFILAWFMHPAVLGWLAAVSAPLLIHLLSRRRYRETTWAAMQYLLAALRKNSRRIRIEQWLLLAIRMAIIALLVLAMAEPVFKQLGIVAAPGSHTHHLIVIDTSLSMAYRPTEKSLLDRAKELAAEMVRTGEQGDGYTLIQMADPPVVTVGTPAFESEGFLAEITALPQWHTGANLPRTIEKITQTLEKARKEFPRLSRAEVTIISDLGRSTWQPDLTDEGANQLREAVMAITQSAQFSVVDLGSADADNLCVTDLHCSDRVATIRKNLAVEASITNFGRQDQTQVLVELLVDGRRVGETHVDIPAGESVITSLPYRSDVPGERQVELLVAPDPLEVDNHRYLSLPVREELRVLCVNGRPSASPLDGATDFLAFAFAPEQHPGATFHVRPMVVSERSLVEMNLAEFDAIFIANVARFVANEANILRNYLESGGGVVIFLGDQVIAEEYNRVLFNSENPSEGILPARLMDVSNEPQFSLNPLNYVHPLLDTFRGQEESGLLTTPVNSHYRLEVPKGIPSRVALQFDSGDPFIVERTVGRGHSILVSTTADTSWTAMPVWPSFVPLVHELLAVAIMGRAEERNVTVGQSLGGILASLGPSTIQVKVPGKEAAQIKPEFTHKAARWVFDDTVVSGVYEAQIGAPVNQRQIFAVNVDSAESDLSKLDANELTSGIWEGVTVGRSPQHASDGGSVSLGSDQEGYWHRPLLASALVLLLLEVFLTYFFSRRSV